MRPMTPEEFGDFRRDGRAVWAEELARSGGLGRGPAHEKAADDYESLIPEENGPPGHYLFVLEDESSRPVGTLWYAERARGDEKIAYLYDLRVAETERASGVGRAAMELLEEEARLRGCGALELNVFGDNQAARGLYRSVGYVETFVGMRKALGPPGS